MAGMPICSQPENRSAIRAAPSSIEYSEWTCRWTNEPPPGWMLPGIPHQPPNSKTLAARAPAGREGEAQQATTLVARSSHTSLRRASDSTVAADLERFWSAAAQRQDFLNSPDVADR